MAPSASARAIPPATFFRGMARVGWSTSRVAGAEPEGTAGARPVARRGVDVEGVAHHGGRDPVAGQLAPATARSR